MPDEKYHQTTGTTPPPAHAAFPAARSEGALLWSWDGGSSELVLRGITEPAPRALAGWLQWVHPADRTRLDHTLRSALDEGAAFAIEFRGNEPDDEPRWWLMQGRRSSAPRRLVGTLV